LQNYKKTEKTLGFDKNILENSPFLPPEKQATNAPDAHTGKADRRRPMKKMKGKGA